MKTPTVNPFILILILTLFSCKKEFPDNPFDITDLSVSACKSDGDAIGINDPEYINLKTIDNYYIQFTHVNSLFNCAPGQITVSLEINSDTITIDESESEAHYDCICPYDVKFRAGPFQYGTYSFIFQKGGLPFKQYTFDFKKSTDIQIDINR
jgi:hypothetical protein